MEGGTAPGIDVGAPELMVVLIVAVKVLTLLTIDVLVVGLAAADIVNWMSPAKQLKALYPISENEIVPQYGKSASELDIVSQSLVMQQPAVAIPGEGIDMITTTCG